MGRLQTKAAEWEFTEYNRLLTEQFIGGLNQEGMTDEILKEVEMLEDTAVCFLVVILVIILP